jgi:hypothetical protein
MIPGNKQVIIVEKSRPALVKKIVYFKDKNFTDRLLPPPKVPLLEIKDHKIPKFNLKKKASPSKQEEPDDDSQIELPLKDVTSGAGETEMNDLVDDSTDTPSSDEQGKQSGPEDSPRKDREMEK